jgi:hypothetical protein
MDIAEGRARRGNDVEIEVVEQRLGIEFRRVTGEFIGTLRVP